LSELRAASRPCALVTVTDTSGSTPREPGARMIVTDGRLFWGTIGGGNLEHLAIGHANSLLGQGEQCSESVDYPLSEKAGQCCGGQVTLFFETFPWSRQQVTVFGAGHVGQALGGLAGYLRAKVLLIDSRDEAHLEPPLSKPRDFEVLFIDSPEEEVDTLPATSLVLIMTHSHALDLEILARALQRGTFAYVGLIGSERKWARFRKRLEQRGFTAEQLDRVVCPIGLGRPSKEPSAIAVSVAAELLGVLAARPEDTSDLPTRGGDNQPAG
jgi:xanthine dehydrogenase accessory factor